jgi:hypothetical protein
VGRLDGMETNDVLGWLQVEPALNQSEIDHLSTLTRDDEPCPWAPSPDGKHLTVRAADEPDDCARWLRHVIRQFFRPASPLAKRPSPAFKRFTFDHRVNGMVVVRRPDLELLWSITARDNRVSARLLWSPEAQQQRRTARGRTPTEPRAVVIDLASRRARA